MKGYVEDREWRFVKEKEELKNDPNFFHTLHEQVALNFNTKNHEKLE